VAARQRRRPFREDSFEPSALHVMNDLVQLQVSGPAKHRLRIQPQGPIGCRDNGGSSMLLEELDKLFDEYEAALEQYLLDERGTFAERANRLHAADVALI
jgi:hypothetical protein